LLLAITVTTVPVFAEHGEKPVGSDPYNGFEEEDNHDDDDRKGSEDKDDDRDGDRDNDRDDERDDDDDDDDRLSLGTGNTDMILYVTVAAIIASIGYTGFRIIKAKRPKK
jgi:ABC-type Zn2+ transport system substrate-binding protein/surface adhesin